MSTIRGRNLVLGLFYICNHPTGQSVATMHLNTGMGTEGPTPGTTTNPRFKKAKSETF